MQFKFDTNKDVIFCIVSRCHYAPQTNFYFVSRNVHRVGEFRETDLIIQGLEHRVLVRGKDQSFSFGTINCPTVVSGWSKCSHLCSIGDPYCVAAANKSTAEHNFQRVDRVKWTAVPGTDVTVIYHQLGAEPWHEDHWFFRMQATRHPVSTVLVFIDPGAVVFSEDYRRKMKQIGTTG
mmetsp:Transcript_15716/g.22424  ORF Transcript_15716/g.22424 Transcript_15716/m.22424 type:complete len:178 (+) Transcript_15716:2823-3356(+)